MNEAFLQTAHAAMAKLGGSIVDHTRNEAQDTAASRVGKVLGRNVGGGYDVELTNGHVLSNIPSKFRTQWQEGQSVTVERTNGYWGIVGVGHYYAWGSGDPTDPVQ